MSAMQLEWVDDVSEGGTNHNRDLLQRVWGGQIQVVDETDFIDDHLFCEWASFVDFGHRRVHVTAGWHDRKSAMWTFDGLRLDCFNDIDKVGVKEKQQLRIDDGTNGTHSSNGIVKVGVKEKEQLRIGDGTSDTQ